MVAAPRGTHRRGGERDPHGSDFLDERHRWMVHHQDQTLIFYAARRGGAGARAAAALSGSGTGVCFTTKIRLRSYVGHAGGLREGAPVRLAGVDIGNVTSVRIVNGKPLTPVEIMMKVNTKYAFNLRKDSVTILSTAGILGET